MVFSKGNSEKMPLMNWIVGILGIVFCIFDCFVVCKHPAFQKGGEFYKNVLVGLSCHVDWSW